MQARATDTLRVLAALLAWLWAASCPALTSDRDQPMVIEADRAELDDRSGVSVYRGNVTITQGTLRLWADVVTVHSADGAITRVVADGEPARYRQLPDGREAPVEARARHMEYTRAPERIVLQGDAEVTQSGNRFQSARIVYDIAGDVVTAGDPAGGERVRITVQPGAGEARPGP